LNVVFDLGGVVIAWDPLAIVSSVFDDPRSTVFIDDVQANIDAAAAHSIRTIRYHGAEACRAELEALGCRVAQG
jgi:FMN phosphatase YigB (HAD superfamily)